MKNRYKVKILPSNIEFFFVAEESILCSAIKHNVHLGYSCMNGECGACKTKLMKGTVKYLTDPVSLSESEIEEGFILTCCSQALSDVELLANYYPELALIKCVLQPCKVAELSFPAADVAILKLKLPPTANFKYLAGQYIKLIIKGERRSYSVANILETYSGVEIHVRRVIGGLFSEYIFNELKLNQLLRIEGPFGSFFVREGYSPIVFLAGGTGFAPVKSMVEQLIKENDRRKIYIYWGASAVSGFYSDDAEKWQAQHDNIKYIPVHSGEPINGIRNGMVHQAVIDDFGELSDYEIYACGSQAMIETAKRSFLSNGLKLNNFYSDAFVSSEK